MSRRFLLLLVTMLICGGAIVFFLMEDPVVPKQSGEVAATGTAPTVPASDAALVNEATNLEEEIVTLRQEVLASGGTLPLSATTTVFAKPSGATSKDPKLKDPATGARADSRTEGEIADEEKKRSRRAQRSLVISQYGDMGTELGLSPELTKLALQVLEDHQIETTEAHRKLSGTEGYQYSIKARKDLENKMRSVLGDETYARYDEYQKSYVPRSNLRQVGEYLSEIGHPFSAEQKQAMIEMMKQEYQVRLHDSGTKGPVSIEKTRDMMASAEERYFQRIQEKAAGILNADQVAGLVTVQKAYLARRVR